MGALRCGANSVVILRDKNWKQRLAEVCEGWCAKQQEKDEGTAHPWACSKRGAAFGCVISLLNKAAAAHTLCCAQHRIALGMVKSWIRGNGQMQTCSLGQRTWVLQTNPLQAQGGQAMDGWRLFVQTHHLNLWNNFGL